MLLSRMMLLQLCCFSFVFSANIFAQHDPFKDVTSTQVLPLETLAKEKLDTNMVVDITDIEALFQKQNENAQHVLDISPLIFSALQQDANYNKHLYVLDLRGEKAYNISHIENAKSINVEKFSVEDIWAFNKKGVFILYSLQGENIKEIATALQSFGFECIFKLEGNFLEWFNQGYSIQDKSNQATNQIFLPNKQLSKLLKRGKAVY